MCETKEKATRPYRAKKSLFERVLCRMIFEEKVVHFTTCVNILNHSLDSKLQRRPKLYNVGHCIRRRANCANKSKAYASRKETKYDRSGQRIEFRVGESNLRLTSLAGISKIAKFHVVLLKRSKVQV
jgi:hypothetical protein